MYLRSLITIISLLLLSALACSLPGGSEEPPSDVPELGEISSQPTEQQQSETAAVGGEQIEKGEVIFESGGQEQPDAGEEETDTLPDSSETSNADSPLPVGIREGLASLNSYQLIISTINNGPTAQDRNESQITITYNSEEDARQVHTESLSSSAEDPEITQSIEDQYQIGLSTCTVSTGDGSVDATAEEITPLIRDMVESTSVLFDINITIPNPTFVGSESINGIETDHYTFKVTGLGDYSGEEVTASEGDYWMALDGQYLVKYDLILEVRTGPEGDPNSEVMHSEFGFELEQVNQPISISMPSECVSAETEQS